MAKKISYQSYAWSLGTTSFRMADFHKKVEEQIAIIDEFWKQPDLDTQEWDETNQKKYYDFAYSKGFITGKIKGDQEKAKTAREKTSGLRDIGLIYENRQLTDIGSDLLNHVKNEDFSSDNDFLIPADSFIYFKQLLKTQYYLSKDLQNPVRPFLITGKLIKECDGYLTDSEFTYLLPLCITETKFSQILDSIKKLRNHVTTIEEILVNSVLNDFNYPQTLDIFLKSFKTIEDFKNAGLNRKSPKFDEIYYYLYKELKEVYLKKDLSKVEKLAEVSQDKSLKTGILWRKLLFVSIKRKKIELSANEFDNIKNTEHFDRIFFKYLHLFKIKSFLSDIRDLNQRYLKITDSIVFRDGKVEFSPIFRLYFETDAGNVFKDSFTSNTLLSKDCSLEDINPNLVFDPQKIISVFNKAYKQKFSNLTEIYNYFEEDRYKKFRILIDNKFPKSVLISLLEDCENRKNDKKLISDFGGEADVPTIFEYIVGVAWYRISQYQGKILDYMNLSLGADLLPRSHAVGGESDIVYKYAKTRSYPEHTLLIECTLMESTTQRHGEMEPVSRHLSNYLIDVSKDAYCTFVANRLHASVISDFRGRKYTYFYRNKNEGVDSMKIIPLASNELKTILQKDLTYTDLYKLFNEAYLDYTIKNPPEWYRLLIKENIEKI